MLNSDFESLCDSKFAELTEEQQFGNVFNSIKWFAKERGLTPLQVKEIFTDGILVNYQNGKLKSHRTEIKEPENSHAVR